MPYPPEKEAFYDEQKEFDERHLATFPGIYTPDDPENLYVITVKGGTFVRSSTEAAITYMRSQYGYQIRPVTDADNIQVSTSPADDPIHGFGDIPAPKRRFTPTRFYDSRPDKRLN